MTDKIPSNVPMAARKQINEANRLIKEANAPQPAAPAAPAPTSQPVAAAPVVQQDDPVKLVEHKYSVLQGKYNAETNRLTGQVQALTAENQRLLATATAPPTAAPRRPEDQFDTSMVTPKEREEYGAELVDMMARIAKANSAGEVAALKQELTQMRGQVQANTQVVASTAMERIWAHLDNNVPAWRTINISQQFVDWLQVLDVMSGQSRQVGLTQAFESGDGPRVVGIFKRFVEEDSQSRSTPAAPAPQLDQGTLIAPGSPRGSGGEAPNGTNKRMVPEQEIDEFYSRVQRGRIGADEKKALEAELQEAVRDGRVIPRHDTRHLSNRN